jgi:hypothetical protein
MRSLATALALCLLCPTLAVRAQDPPAPYLSDGERAELLRLFDESENLLLRLLAGVSDAQWSFKPAPDRWSVGECAEHMVRSNEYLYDAAKAGLARAADPDWFEKTIRKTELLKEVMPNRQPFGANGATAPQEVRPEGKLSRSEIVQRFNALYAELRAHVRDTEEPLKQHTEAHPFPVFNPLNAHQWILYVPLHTIRHSRQMIEVMETEGYPVS